MNNNEHTNYVLASMAAGFKVFGLTMTDSANILLTGLSIISVTMLIIINWSKFLKAVKRNKE